MNHEIKIPLSSIQYKKLLNDKPLQLKNSDLTNFANKHTVAMNVAPEMFKKYTRAINTGKGLRIPAKKGMVKGGSILSSATRIAKSVPKSFVRDVEHGYDEARKIVVGKSLVTKIAKTVGNTIANSKAPEILVTHLLKGNGLSQKGSQQMKDRMQALRDRRNGGNILGTLTKIGKTMGKPFEKTVGINPFTAGYDVGLDIGNAIKGNGINLNGIANGVINKTRKVIGVGIVDEPVRRRGRPRKAVGSSMLPNGGSMIPLGGRGIKMKKGTGFLIN